MHRTTAQKLSVLAFAVARYVANPYSLATVCLFLGYSVLIHHCAQVGIAEAEQLSASEQGGVQTLGAIPFRPGRPLEWLVTRAALNPVPPWNAFAPTRTSDAAPAQSPLGRRHRPAGISVQFVSTPVGFVEALLRAGSGSGGAETDALLRAFRRAYGVADLTLLTTAEGPSAAQRKVCALLSRAAAPDEFASCPIRWQRRGSGTAGGGCAAAMAEAAEVPEGSTASRLRGVVASRPLSDNEGGALIVARVTPGTVPAPSGHTASVPRDDGRGALVAVLDIPFSASGVGGDGADAVSCLADALEGAASATSGAVNATGSGSRADEMMMVMARLAERLSSAFGVRWVVLVSAALPLLPLAQQTPPTPQADARILRWNLSATRDDALVLLKSRQKVLHWVQLPALSDGIGSVLELLPSLQTLRLW